MGLFLSLLIQRVLAMYCGSLMLTNALPDDMVEHGDGHSKVCEECELCRPCVLFRMCVSAHVWIGSPAVRHPIWQQHICFDTYVFVYGVGFALHGFGPYAMGCLGYPSNKSRSDEQGETDCL